MEESPQAASVSRAHLPIPRRVAARVGRDDVDVPAVQGLHPVLLPEASVGRCMLAAHLRQFLEGGPPRGRRQHLAQEGQPRLQFHQGLAAKSHVVHAVAEHRPGRGRAANLLHFEYGPLPQRVRDRNLSVYQPLGRGVRGRRQLDRLRVWRGRGSAAPGTRSSVGLGDGGPALEPAPQQQDQVRHLVGVVLARVHLRAQSFPGVRVVQGVESSRYRVALDLHFGTERDVLGAVHGSE
mmetsp:Transcript_75406/g.230641  ORF Transcript_75406/g.230641 Transcript_75406/m.230641 type:complete len:237 (-) Transcript_75406:390-1100(-)